MVSPKRVIKEAPSLAMFRQQGNLRRGSSQYREEVMLHKADDERSHYLKSKSSSTLGTSPQRELGKSKGFDVL